MIDVMTKNGEVNITTSGSLIEIVSDTAMIIKSIYEGIKKSDKEMSDSYKQYVCECIEIFFMTEEELRNEIEKFVSNDTYDILRRFYESE